MRWNRRGLDLMAQSETRKAQAHFRKAIKSLPTLPTGYNNLALCRCAEGDAEGALRTQREGLEVSPLPNPFGQANLASFLWMLGRDEEAEQALAKAMTSTLPSEDACVKVCETLGRFRRHADLLHYADASDYAGL